MCIRPFDAVHMTAGHNAFRGSGPGQKLALEVLWPKWVVLITGSTGLHYVLSALSNRSVTPYRRDLVLHSRASSRPRLPGERDRLPVPLTLGHHRPRHPRELIGQRDRGDSRAAARAALSATADVWCHASARA